MNDARLLSGSTVTHFLLARKWSMEILTVLESEGITGKQTKLGYVFKKNDFKKLETILGESLIKHAWSWGTWSRREKQ